MLSVQFAVGLFVAVVLSFHSALDVSFIPNDENAPLPLSHKYRESLRRLCGLVKVGGRLPEELQAKKQILEKMCDKLAKDDKNIESSDVGSASKWDLKSLAMTLLAAGGGGYVMWNNRHWIKSTAGKLLNVPKVEQVVRNEAFVADNSFVASDGVGNDAFVPKGVADPANQRILEAREARLRRFAEIKINADANNLHQ